MNIKEFFKNYREKRLRAKIQKYARKICHKNTTHDSRNEIIHYLINTPGVESIKALLNRYNITLHEKPIMDEHEKELVATEIISRGLESIEPVKEFLKETREVSRPFDILRQLVSTDEYIMFVLEILTTDEALFDEKVMEKRYDVLNALSGAVHPKIFEKVSKLVNDDDDRIKILALEILAEQKNIDEIKESFLDMLVDPSTPPRLLKSLFDIFAKHQWKVTGYKNKVDSLISHNEYFINKDGIIRKRQGEDGL